jgi:hypothetical protein
MRGLVLGAVLTAAAVASAAPAKENSDLRWLVGAWSCAGTGRGPSGGALSYRARFTFKWDPSGNWLAVHREAQLPRPGPPFAADGFLGWDTAGKRYWLVGVDSDGGWMDLGAAGWEGPSLALTGAAAVDGQRTPMRFTLTRGKTDKDLLFAVESQSGGRWSLIAQDVCKR